MEEVGTQTKAKKEEVDGGRLPTVSAACNFIHGIKLFSNLEFFRLM